MTSVCSSILQQFGKVMKKLQAQEMDISTVIEMYDSLTAVSYTHLDVYKRQRLSGAAYHKKAEEKRQRESKILQKIPQLDSYFSGENKSEQCRCVGPVSYTHLDVYKRQLLYWIPFLR